MDTTLFFYLIRKQETGSHSPFCIKQSVREDYSLIHIGVEKALLEEDAAMLRWEQVTADRMPVREFRVRCRSELYKWLHPFWNGRELLDEWTWECEGALQELIQGMMEEPEFDRSEGEQTAPRGDIWWRQSGMAEIHRFCHYKSARWVRRFLREIPENQQQLFNRQLLILDTCPILAEMLLPVAMRLKSISWIITEEAYEAGEQELVEELELEYGILVNLTLLEKANYRCRLAGGGTPIAIWDFTAEERPWVADLPAGSLWYDFTGKESKQSHIQRRNPQIRYFSLKKQWGAT